jgi:cellulose synthase/poly-beta-1,6-N-acetylglucosamine synthase-like glycosyltransferase
MFDLIFKILFFIMLVYCGFSVVYFFIFSLAGKFIKEKHTSVFYLPDTRIAMLLPAYKEDGVILLTANNLLNLDYPAELFHVYVIADSFADATLKELRKLPLTILEVSFENSTKTKSLNEAFERIGENYDIALICDADNILANDFLKKVNSAFLSGIRAVQGRRVAKNTDTGFALLDGCSEAINNHIFRKGANALGLSSSVTGSGMAFGFSLLKRILSDMSAISGFDKPLQLKIVQSGIKIKYLEDALIFDEKVDNPDSFKQQRRRWLLSQFIYLNQYFLQGCRELMKGNLSYFNLAVANNLVPPRVLLIAAMPLLCIAAYFVQPPFIFYTAVILMLMYILSLLLAIPAELMNKKLWNALLQLPKGIILMAANLFKLRKAKNVFIHTIHTKNEITNPLYNTHGK